MTTQDALKEIEKRVSLDYNMHDGYFEISRVRDYLFSFEYSNPSDPLDLIRAAAILVRLISELPEPNKPTPCA